MMFNRAKISNYKIKKIIECFCLDLTATQTAKLLKFNRKTINSYYNKFRIAIAFNQRAEFQRFVGLIELDESYFGARRMRGFHNKLKRGYTGLVSVGYNKHYRVYHRDNEFAKNKHIHINGIESFWSFTKRRIAKFNGVKKNFYLYLKECEWRWKRNEIELQNDLIKILKRFNKF